MLKAMELIAQAVSVDKMMMENQFQPRQRNCLKREVRATRTNFDQEVAKLRLEQLQGGFRGSSNPASVQMDFFDFCQTMSKMSCLYAEHN